MLSPLEFKQRLLPFFNTTQIKGLDHLYPDDGNILPFHNISQIIANFYFHCPARKVAKAYSNAGLPVYKSFYKHLLGLVNIIEPVRNYGVFHGSDLPMWWQLEAPLGLFGERRLSQIMSGAMFDFARCNSSTPNCKIGGATNSLEWPLYSNETRINLDLPCDEFTISTDKVLDSQCEYFESAIDWNDPKLSAQSPPSKPPSPMKSPWLDSAIKFINKLYFLFGNNNLSSGEIDDSEILVRNDHEHGPLTSRDMLFNKKRKSRD